MPSTSTMESTPPSAADTADPAFARNGRREPADEIPMLQLLNEQGEYLGETPPDLSDEALRKIHRAMVLTRKFDVRMLNMQRQGEMGTFAPGYGQEATQIGQVWPLQDQDWYSPSYRSFGAQIWRGWPMDHLMLLWDGYFEGFAPPPGINDLPFSIVIGSHVPVAVGIGMAIRKKGAEDAVVMVNFGDGASSQGAVAEGFTFAATSKAPVIFVLENNGWAISSRPSTQSAAPDFARRGPAFGMPGERVDGNDIFAMLEASRRAVAHARSGEGPYLIEAVTYRMGVHTTADDPKVYREDAEVEAWAQKCPIARLETYLKSRGILTDAAADAVGTDCEQEVLAAREAFRGRAKANPHEVFDYMFDEMPPELADQQAEYFAKLDRQGVPRPEGR